MVWGRGWCGLFYLFNEKWGGFGLAWEGLGQHGRVLAGVGGFGAVWEGLGWCGRVWGSMGGFGAVREGLGWCGRVLGGIGVFRVAWVGWWRCKFTFSFLNGCFLVSSSSSSCLKWNFDLASSPFLKWHLELELFCQETFASYSFFKASYHWYPLPFNLWWVLKQKFLCARVNWHLTPTTAHWASTWGQVAYFKKKIFFFLISLLLTFSLILYFKWSLTLKKLHLVEHIQQELSLALKKATEK